MAVVASWDGADRHIHLAQGVTEFHPIDDIYREYRTERSTNEAFRVWEPFMEAIGNEPKGGGRFTPRYLLLLQGAKIVPYDEDAIIDITGEILTDDQTSPIHFDTLSPGTTILMNYFPPTAEVIQISSGSGLSAEQDALLSLIGNRTGDRQRVWIDAGDGNKVKMTTYAADGITPVETNVLLNIAGGIPLIDPDSITERGAPT